MLRTERLISESSPIPSGTRLYPRLRFRAAPAAPAAEVVAEAMVAVATADKCRIPTLI